ncbi:MAG: DUF2202 domain-containing protein [Caldilineaceae bacterium]
MKSSRTIPAALIVCALLTLTVLPAFGSETPAAPAPAPVVTALPAATALTDAQAQGLSYMREEEKLAHDLYVTMGEIWGTRAFANIAQAETRHQSAVTSLQDRYGLDTPAADSTGIFVDGNLQALYDVLAVQGAESLTAALQAGALVEETDIADLDELLADSSLPPDVVAVYTNLRAGSANHLRAYVRLLARQGEIYEPAVLPSDSFARIVQGRSGNRP